MSRAQRAKGIRAELEVAALLRGHGFHARRDGRLDADLAHDLDGYHLEVRRREMLALPAETRDAEHAAGGRVAIVCYRRSREPWHASLTARRARPPVRDRTRHPSGLMRHRLRAWLRPWLGPILGAPAGVMA